jgi:hypothetical protein
MRIFLATLVTALLWISLMPVDAQTIYPTQRCRVYYDTEFIKIPGQCGTIMPFYPRKLFVRTSRQPAITRIVADIDLPQVSFLA